MGDDRGDGRRSLKEISFPVASIGLVPVLELIESQLHWFWVVRIVIVALTDVELKPRKEPYEEFAGEAVERRSGPGSS